jgi:hypothetical protein
LGVTGTPVIDPATQAIYVAAAVGGEEVHHKVFALRLNDGSPLPGWPVDIADALHRRGLAFNAPDQNERGALTILEGRLYVPFGGHFGDCGVYHGWVVGISLSSPREVIAWSTPARGGGIWAPGGIATDGKSLYVATGNTFGASRWMGGEAVIRLSPDLKTSANRRDFFTPENWRSLDARDLDLGGANPLMIKMSGSGGDRPFVLALGKDGHAYLLDRDNLGGVGGSLVDEIVSPRAIRTAPAAYQVAGSAFVAFQGPGSRCPAGRPAGDHRAQDHRRRSAGPHHRLVRRRAWRRLADRHHDGWTLRADRLDARRRRRQPPAWLQGGKRRAGLGGKGSAGNDDWAAPFPNSHRHRRETLRRGRRPDLRLRVLRGTLSRG